MRWNALRQNKGNFLLLAGIVLIWLLLFGLFQYYGYTKTWELWGVQTRGLFMDFRLIPGSAESFRQGFEPTVENPLDPEHRIFNYPAFWRLFFYTNITLDDTVWIVILMLVLYFVGILLLPRKLSVPGAFWMLLIAFSPAAMLLYERGNADLIVFFICVLIVLAAERSAYWAGGLIAFGAVVKMFPLFGLTVLLRESKRKFWIVTAACLAFMLVYGILTFASQNAAWNTTMRGSEASYGTFVLITRFGSLFPKIFSIRQWEFLFELLAVLLIVLAVLPAVRNPQPLQAAQERHLAAFRMGASIYVGTFLLGNNWDYRLPFLIFVIPQLAEWFHAEQTRHRAVAMGVMLAVILTCWHFLFLIDLPFLPFPDEIDRIVAFDEFVNWLLVPGFAYLLAASFPEWLREDLQKVLGVRGRRSLNIYIRRALPEEANSLSKIAQAAKAYWGYPRRWLEAWLAQLTFSPQYFEENEGWVAVVEQKPVGFYTLQEENGNACIENLWVLPEFIGKGIGKVLFLHAVELARQRGYKILQLESDPNAVGFYKKMGMYQIGESQYELEGQPRRLPVMEMKL